MDLGIIIPEFIPVVAVKIAAVKSVLSPST